MFRSLSIHCLLFSEKQQLSNMYENLIPLLTKYTSWTATLRLSLLLHGLDCHLVFFDHNTLCNVFVDTKDKYIISIGHSKHGTLLIKYRPLFEYLLRRLRRIRELHLHVGNDNTINLTHLSSMNTKFTTKWANQISMSCYYLYV